MYFGHPLPRVPGESHAGLGLTASVLNVSASGRVPPASARLIQGFDKWYQDHMLSATATKIVPSTWPRQVRGRIGQLPGQFSPSTGGAGDSSGTVTNSSGLRWRSTIGIPSVSSEVIPCPREVFLSHSEITCKRAVILDGNGNGSVNAVPYVAPSPMIKDVWKGNLDNEFARIRSLLPKYRYVAMDTEFPGVVIRNAPCYRNLEGNQLETIRKNVDVLKLIQLGISFFDENGCNPPGTSTWQFNFKFNIKQDRCAQSSIDLLQEAGMQFERHVEEGIDPEDFCYLFFSSGLVLQEEVSWLTYHGGYDFGYLMRILRGQNLPADPDEFSDFMRTYFPTCYDVKVLLAGNPSFVGGLHDTAVRLGLKRVGSPHQAGSDSLLTGKAFFRVKQKFFEHTLGDSILEKYNGKIYGFGRLDDCFVVLNSKNQDMDYFELDTNEVDESNASLDTDSYSFPMHCDESGEPISSSSLPPSTTAALTC